MRPITNLQLFHSAIFVVLLAALAFVLQVGVGKSYLFLIVLALVVSTLAAMALNFLYRRRAGGNSRWVQPVSDKAGARILDTAVGAWLILVGLLIVAMVIIGLRSSPQLGTIVVFLLSAGVALGRLLHNRMATKSQLPYGISLTIALALMMLALSMAHVLRMTT